MLSALLATALAFGTCCQPTETTVFTGAPALAATAGPTAPHVPVITPTNKPKGDLPPRIEPKPLPPV